MEMTRRERLMNIFENKPIDRPALKLWGTAPGMKALHPAYQPVIDKSLELTDLFGSASSPCHLIGGARHSEFVHVEKKPTADPLWFERHTTVETPLGPLHSIYRDSVLGDPGFTLEYLIKDEEDIRFQDCVLSDLKVQSFSFSEMHIGNLGMDTRGEVQADSSYPDQGLWDGRRGGGT